MKVNQVSFDKKLIVDKVELLQHIDDISMLFEKCFKFKLEVELWKWAYIDNVNGSPIVSLYYEQGVLVGHYAIIPMKLILNGETILAALSMTTMVDISYRRHGVFAMQATEVYKKAEELGFSLVYGFPNKQSAPGFRKRLGWIIEDTSSYVIKTRGRDLVSKDLKLDNKICFNDQDREFMKWRLLKPSSNYIKKGKVVIKKFKNDFDVVFHNGDFSNLEPDNYYNVLVEHINTYQQEKLFDYIFGYKIFDDNLLGYTFKKDLLMSDVF